MKQNKEAAAGLPPAANPLQRTVAALGLLAQLTALLAAALDARLPHALALGWVAGRGEGGRCGRALTPVCCSEYCNGRVSAGGLAWRGARLGACVAALSARSGLRPARPALAGLDAVRLAAAADAEPLGRYASAPPRPAPHPRAALHSMRPSARRVEAWMSGSLADAWAACDDGWAGAEPDADDCEPPEHLHWPETQEVRTARPAPRRPAAADARLRRWRSRAARRPRPRRRW